jgi:predicted RNA-binding protein with PUA-like domain
LGWYVTLPETLLIIGVRSHEAKKIMKEKMKLGDKVRLAESLLEREIDGDRC